MRLTFSFESACVPAEDLRGIAKSDGANDHDSSTVGVTGEQVRCCK